MIEHFYQSTQYHALREREVPRTPPGGDIHFSHHDPAARQRFFDYFDETSTERIGILHGEYLLMNAGLVLIDRDAKPTGASWPAGDTTIYGQPWAQTVISAAVAQWDDYPLISFVPIITNPYGMNYYHFSLELIPRLRHFTSFDQMTPVIPQQCLAKKFQCDLFARILGRRSVVPFGGVARVRDPVLIQDIVSEEGLLWLRGTSGISARLGNRRIYIRRGRDNTGTRMGPGGGIVESEAFLAILRHFSFEVVEFGKGELGIAEQVAMLDGAAVILASHGAALTNLAYLDPNVTLIEVIGVQTPRACFMHIAATIGMRYHGIYRTSLDDGGDIIVDMDELGDVLREVC